MIPRNAIKKIPNYIEERNTIKKKDKKVMKVTGNA